MAAGHTRRIQNPCGKEIKLNVDRCTDIKVCITES